MDHGIDVGIFMYFSLSRDLVGCWDLRDLKDLPDPLYVSQTFDRYCIFIFVLQDKCEGAHAP